MWVTPNCADERHAAGNYPNQSQGGDGLPKWTQSDRAIADRDLVVWYTFGVTHFVRPEDWPVLPTQWHSLSLVPYGFFDRNPSIEPPKQIVPGAAPK